MLEIIDNFVTTVLTFMIYAVPVCSGIVFIHFVATHPVSQNSEPTVTAEETEIQAVAEGTLRSTVRPANQSEKIVIAATTQQPNNPEIVCEPVNWHVWKVKDLRKTALRTLFNIKVRHNGQACRKCELIAQYENAMQGSSGLSPRTIPHTGAFVLKC